MLNDEELPLLRNFHKCPVLNMDVLHNRAALHGSCIPTVLFPCLLPPLLLSHISQSSFYFLSFDLFPAEPAFQCSFNPSNIHSFDPSCSPSLTPTPYFSYLKHFNHSRGLYLDSLATQTNPPRRRSGSHWFIVLDITIRAGIKVTLCVKISWALFAF